MGAAWIGLTTVACGDRNLDAIKIPAEGSLGGSSVSGGASASGGNPGSGGSSGRRQEHTAGLAGIGGDDGLPRTGGSGGNDSGATGGEWAKGGRGTGGGDVPNGGRGTGGSEAFSGGHGSGGRNTGGNGGWPSESGGAFGTGGRFSSTGGSTGLSTGGGGQGPPPCPETVPDNGGQCSRLPQSPPCYYQDTLCSCNAGQWMCAQCPEGQPEASSDCPVNGETCWYGTSTVCYCALSWVCGNTGSESGAAGAAGAGGSSGAAGSATGGDAGVQVPEEDCPAAKSEPWKSEGQRCNKYGPGAYCEYGPSWWCICTEGGWHCSFEKPDQNTQAT